MSTTKYTPRLADKYKKEVVPALMKTFQLQERYAGAKA